MTPREKADLLIRKFIKPTYSMVHNNRAKECALICADILIDDWTFATNGLIPSDDQFSFDQLKYWKDVRKEIESF
jgi:hypothetical protein